MKEIVNENYPIERLTVNRLKMIDYFNSIGSVDNAILLKYISNTYINLYRLDDIYDYFYGHMPYSTSAIDEFKLSSIELSFLLIYLLLLLSSKTDENGIVRRDNVSREFDALSLFK